MFLAITVALSNQSHGCIVGVTAVSIGESQVLLVAQ